MTVRRLVVRVFEGGRIVYGSHPTFTPVIERCTTPRDAGSERATSCGHDRGGTVLRSRSARLIPGTSTSSVTPDMRKSSRSVNSRLASRRQLIDSVRGWPKSSMPSLCIGGRSHEEDGEKPGVEQEVELARRLDKPVYLLGGFGGHTRSLLDRPRFLSSVDGMGENGLTEADNQLLCRVRSIPDAASTSS